MTDNMQDATIKRTFVFNGKTYTMGRLVLAVIKDFAATHKGTNPKALREAFPDSLLAEGALHLVEDKAKITPNLEGRYFLKPDELIPVLGATIAVSNRWHRFNIYNFLPHARALGYDITELHDGVAVGEVKNTSKPAPKNGKAAPQKAVVNKKEPAPAKASPKTAKQAPKKPTAEKTSMPPAAQSKTTAAPRWKEHGEFLAWMKEGDASYAVRQWAFQSAEEVISSIGNGPLDITQIESLATYIYTTANVFAVFERQAYHGWISIYTSPRPNVSGDGKKEYIDFLGLREDKNLDERAQNVALKKLGAYTTSAGVEPLSNELLNIIVNLCMNECLAIVTSVYNLYHEWLSMQTDFCLEYPPYEAYRSFMDHNEALTQFKNLVGQNLMQVRQTGRMDFLNQYQFEPLETIAEIVTLSYMDSIAKDYHNWLDGGTVAKKTPQKAAAPKSESTAKSQKALSKESKRPQASEAAQKATQDTTPKQLEKAAKGGDEFAMFQLGQLYWMGVGVPQNREKALEWLTAAENHGSDDATYYLKYLVENGELLLAEDNAAPATGGAAPAAATATAVGSYGMFDDKGKLYDVNVPPGTAPPNISFINGVATQYAVGREELDKGHECQKNNDIVGAEKYWLNAAGKGNFAAMCNLGNLYHYYHSPPPMDRVWYWYQQAAAGGVKEAAAFLQSMSGR